MKRSPFSSSNQLLDTLPNPSGSLSEKIPSDMIADASKEVTKVLENEPCYTGGPYLTLIPVQKFTIGKRAAEYGTTVAIRFFVKKYPELKGTTVRKLKNMYQLQLRDQLPIRNDDTSASIENI